MRSLFAKIMAWFLLGLAITTGGYLYITARSLSGARPRQHLIGRLLEFQLEEARHAYESDGRAGLEAYLARLRENFRAEGILTDAAGRDLLSGQDRSELIATARARPTIPPLRPALIGRASEDGRYWFLLQVPRGRPGFLIFHPEYFWILGAVILLAYALAFYLTSPLRSLRRAVERFGHGDFTARVRTRRRDELGELGRTFDRMAERIQTLVAAERRLLLDISHELRSPLTRLGVAVELARSGEDREATLNRIQKEAERLNALMSQLLEVTRAEGDPKALRDEPVRLDELVQDVAEACALEAQAKGCTIERNPGPAVTVCGDAELLRRALENVVRNAVRYAPEGTPVEISLAAGGRLGRLSVRDQGPGVPEDRLPSIFEPFYRVETGRDRTSGGAGLGLAIARRAIELHKGTIAARNAAPGLLVEIQIPLAV